MATKFLLLYLLFSTVNADCTSTYLDHYDGNIVASYEACATECDQQSVCGSAYFQSSSGACETFDCVDNKSNFPGWTQYTKAGAEKCPEALQSPEAEPASTKLTTVTISDPLGTKCTSEPASISAAPTAGASRPSSTSLISPTGSPPSTSGQPRTGLSTSGPSVTTPLASSTLTSASSQATPSPSSNEASFGPSGSVGLVIAGICLMISVFI